MSTAGDHVGQTRARLGRVDQAREETQDGHARAEPSPRSYSENAQRTYRLAHGSQRSLPSS